MIRISTALLAMLSLLATPLVSIACTARCELFLMHQHPLCHEKAHEYMGPHVHHMNHVHMVSEEREPVVVSRIEQFSKVLAAPPCCPTSACARLAPAVSRRTTAVRSSKLEASSFTPAAAVRGSPPTCSRNSLKNVVATSDTLPCSTSAPLRI